MHFYWLSNNTHYYYMFFPNDFPQEGQQDPSTHIHKGTKWWTSLLYTLRNNDIFFAGKDIKI